MSTATMAPSGAVHLSRTRQSATRKPNAALPDQLGKSPLLGPLQALVEARMRKAEIELESRLHSDAAASTSTGKEGPTYFGALCSRAATRLSSLACLVFGNAPAPRAPSLPTASPIPPRSGGSKMVEALSRLGLASASSGDTRLAQWGPPLRMCAQGDILIERVDDVPAACGETDVVDATVVILARGELSGHCHRIHGHIRLFDAAALARDIPPGFYVGHLHVKSGSARLEHEEHKAITLQAGTYRVRRQRRLEPTDADIVED